MGYIDEVNSMVLAHEVMITGTDTDTNSLASRFVQKVEGKGLSTNDLTNELKANYDAAYEHSQIAHAPADAQVNVIESIKVNNVAQTVEGKAVNIAVPVADDTSIAITENKIGIKAVDVQKLFIAEGDVLIIDGGKA